VPPLGEWAKQLSVVQRTSRRGPTPAQQAHRSQLGKHAASLLAKLRMVNFESFIAARFRDVDLVGRMERQSGSAGCCPAPGADPGTCPRCPENGLEKMDRRRVSIASIGRTRDRGILDALLLVFAEADPSATISCRAFNRPQVKLIDTHGRVRGGGGGGGGGLGGGGCWNRITGTLSSSMAKSYEVDCIIYPPVSSLSPLAQEVFRDHRSWRDDHRRALVEGPPRGEPARNVQAIPLNSLYLVPTIGTDVELPLRCGRTSTPLPLSSLAMLPDGRSMSGGHPAAEDRVRDQRREIE